MIQFEEHIFQLGWKPPKSWDWSLNLELLRLFSVSILCSFGFWLKCVLIVQMQTMISGKFGVGCFGWNPIISTLASTQELPKINDRNNSNKPETWFPPTLFFSQADFIDIYHILSLGFFPWNRGHHEGVCLSHTRHLLFGLHQTRSSGVYKSMVSMHVPYMERYIPTNERKLMNPSKEQVELVMGKMARVWK